MEGPSRGSARDPSVASRRSGVRETEPVNALHEAQIEVELDGVTHVVSVLPGQLVLEALETVGLEAPFSCRQGCCATCMCQLVEGEVEMLENHVLDQNDLDQKWILACQAVPKSARVKLRYPS